MISARVSNRAAWGFMEAKRRDFCPTTTQVTHQSGSNPNSPGKQVSGALFRLCRSAIPNAFLLIVLTPSHFVALCNIVAPQRTHVAPSILNPFRARSAPATAITGLCVSYRLVKHRNSCCCVLGWPHCRFLTILKQKLREAGAAAADASDAAAILVLLRKRWEAKQVIPTCGLFGPLPQSRSSGGGAASGTPATGDNDGAGSASGGSATNEFDAHDDESYVVNGRLGLDYQVLWSSSSRRDSILVLGVSYDQQLFPSCEQQKLR